jgi:iron complex transport system ATP-binding protein
MTLFDLQSLRFVRGGNEILAGVNWSIREGEHWILLGPNGSGKSTLVKILSGYQWPTSGSASLLGDPMGTMSLLEIRKRIALFEPALQEESAAFHPDLTALEVICTGYFGTLACYDDIPDELLERARSLFENQFESSGLPFPPSREFVKLSSGERRKVLLLRSFFTKARYMILDEPYESLDLAARYTLQELLVRMVLERKIPTLTVLHRIEEIPSFVTHALLLKEGRVFRSGPIESVVNSASISGLYDYPVEVGKRGDHFYCLPDK